MKISKRAQTIEPSLTRKLFNAASGMTDVINLTLGDPDTLPAENIRKAACEAIMAGKTRYSANAGLPALREAYAAAINREYGKTYSPDKDIIATVGGMEALYLSLAATVDDGDEVVILGPYYVNYYQMTRMCGGIPVTVDNYTGTAEERLRRISEAVTDRTVAIIVNSPSNPSGAIVEKEILDGIAEIVKERDIYVISDEVYRTLVFDDAEYHSLMEYPEIEKNLIFIDSCSKRFSMTGWRIGFAVGNEELIASMTKMQENVAACASLPSQYAAIEAYSDRTDISYITDVFQERRDVLYSGLSKIKKLHIRKPQATFYMFVDISETGMDSERFAYALLENEHVAVVPGKTYGKEYDSYIRIAFTLDKEILREAVGRIARFIDSLGD